MQDKAKAFLRLLEIMDDLRAKCPWDMKQTKESLRLLTIEETYELSDAILKNDLQAVKEELGDLMLHMVFYSKIGEEEKAFDVADVLHAVCDKLIRRHPHIYGDVTVEGEEDVKANWEEIKRKEKLAKGEGTDNGIKSVLAGVPDAMPSLIKAYRLQEKTAQFGFEWDDIADVKAKVEEELSELDEAIQRGVQEDIEAEYGDVLFALVNYSRYLKLDPEAALEQSNRKFKHRFQYIEEQAKLQGKDLKDMTLAEMDALWNEAKKKAVKTDRP